MTKTTHRLNVWEGVGNRGSYKVGSHWLTVCSSSLLQHKEAITRDCQPSVQISGYWICSHRTSLLVFLRAMNTPYLNTKMLIFPSIAQVHPQQTRHLLLLHNVIPKCSSRNSPRMAQSQQGYSKNWSSSRTHWRSFDRKSFFHSRETSEQTSLSAKI